MKQKVFFLILTMSCSLLFGQHSRVIEGVSIRSEILKMDRKFSVYLPAGYEGNSLMHIAFRKAAIPHEYRVKEGGHNWSYWRQELPEILEFVSKSFTDF